MWYCIKARSLWFFTSSNPSLTFGGFEGESKREMYDQLPPGSYPRSIYITPDIAFKAVEEIIQSHNFIFPFVVKPDVGMMGFMFRKISCIRDLELYHTKMEVDYIIQEFITYPLEVSVFYYRFPGEQTGTISGFIKKEFLKVKGNGQLTLLQLIQNYDRVRFRQEEMKLKHAANLKKIIPPGEIYYLSFALNLSRGGKLVSLADEIDGKLLKVFDDLSLYTKHFYYGRYDIKCASIDDLKNGKNYSILEYNGCGAEPHHAYGNGNSLIQAYDVFLHHWKVLYKISQCNKKKGIRQWNFNRGRRFFYNSRVHFKKLKELDYEQNL